MKIKKEVFDISSIAVKSILYEVSALGKPGLVTPTSTGSHKDMDFFTFINSTSSLLEYIIKFCQGGFSNESPKKIFNSLREVGKEAEINMFKHTNGVNVHKGMIFLMGTSCAAVSKAVHEKKDFDSIQCIIKEMTSGIVNKELKQNKELKKNTYGEILYEKYGVTGIRGEVEKGIPIVFQHSLPWHEQSKNLNQNDRLIHTLIYIMQYCEDTNILHRHSIKTLKDVQNQAKQIIKIGGMTTENGKKAIHNMNIDFINNRISPGGAADLLAVTIFFYNIKKYCENLS